MDPCSICGRNGRFKCKLCNDRIYCSIKCKKKDEVSHSQNCSKKETTGEATKSNSSRQEATQSKGASQATETNQIPKFHKEYASKYRNDSQQHIAKLCSAHQILTETNYNAIDSKIQAVAVEDESKKLFFKRWGMTNFLDQQFHQFLENSELGSVFDQKIAPSYSPKFQTMKNYNLPEWILEFGKNHVSVGCVDFQQLLLGRFGSEEEKSPMIFYGIDTEVVSITRCWVLYKMMKDDADPISILQVWFSSGWAQKTLQEFNGACNTLLASSSMQNEGENKLLKHWISTKVTLENANDLWSKDVMKKERNRPFQPCANMVFEVDRVDYARYLFTGYIFANDEKDLLYGNVTMFSSPKEMDCKRADDENFFHTFNFNHGDFQYDKSLKDSIAKFMLEKVQTVQTLVKEGRILMNFEVATVGPEKHDILGKIKSYNAYTIDWSNLMDYFTKDDFLKMAWHVNSEETVHYFHMMNWVNCFKGASIFDYPFEQKIVLIEEALEEQRNMEKALQEYGRKYSLIDYGLMAANCYNAMDMVDCMLSMQNKDAYFQHIFGDEVTVKPGNSIHSIFSRSHTTITAGFTFDNGNTVKLITMQKLKI